MYKKILLSFIALLFVSTVAFAASPVIVQSLSKASYDVGEKYLDLGLRGQQVPNNSYIEWYAYNIGGASRINFYGVDASSGNTTTLSAVAVFGDKTVVSTNVQDTITSGTDYTAIKGGNYCFRFYNNVAATTNVTLNFLIVD